MTSVISSKGQITIPVEVRRRLGLGTGTPVEFVFVPEGVLLRKGMPGVDPVAEIYGSLRSHPTPLRARSQRLSSRGSKKGGAGR